MRIQQRLAAYCAESRRDNLTAENAEFIEEASQPGYVEEGIAQFEALLAREATLVAA